MGEEHSAFMLGEHGDAMFTNPETLRTSYLLDFNGSFIAEAIMIK